MDIYIYCSIYIFLSSLILELIVCFSLAACLLPQAMDYFMHRLWIVQTHAHQGRSRQGALVANDGIRNGQPPPYHNHSHSVSGETILIQWAACLPARLADH